MHWPRQSKSNRRENLGCLSTGIVCSCSEAWVSDFFGCQFLWDLLILWEKQTPESSKQIILNYVDLQFSKVNLPVNI